MRTRYTSRDVGNSLFFSFLSFSFSVLSFPYSLFPLRADVTKSAVANALRSGLPLENREDELLPRGESIPRSLWWSKGDCRNQQRRGGAQKATIAGRDAVEGEGWLALGYRRWWYRRREVGSYTSVAKRAKGVICTRRGCTGERNRRGGTRRAALIDADSQVATR